MLIKWASLIADKLIIWKPKKRRQKARERGRRGERLESKGGKLEVFVARPASRARCDSRVLSATFGSSHCSMAELKERKKVFAKGFLSGGLARDELIRRLKATARVLSAYEQEPDALISGVPASLLSTKLMRNKNKEVKILVALCHGEILRIYAPDAPYSESELERVFSMFISQLQGLSRPEAPGYAKYFHLLENLAVTKAFLILTDLEGGLLEKLFRSFLEMDAGGVGSRIEYYMVDILKAVLEECEEVGAGPLDAILEPLARDEGDDDEQDKDDDEGASAPGRNMALSLISKAEGVLEEPVLAFLRDTVVRRNEAPRNSSITEREDQLRVLFRLALNSPEFALPLLTEYQGASLLNADAEQRLECADFFGRLFCAKGFVVSQPFSGLMRGLIDRLNDVDASVRARVLELAPGLFPRAGDNTARLQRLVKLRTEDLDDKVRRQAVLCVVAAAGMHPRTVPADLLYALGGRAMDRKIAVRREALVGLANLFKKHISERWKAGQAVDKSLTKFTWIPTRLVQVANVDLQMSYFVEGLLADVVVPESFSPSERAKCLVGVFANFTDTSRAAFRRMLKQKRTVRGQVRGVMDAWAAVQEGDGDTATLRARFDAHAGQLARLLPAPSGNYEGVSVVKDLFTHKNPKVTRLLNAVADATAEHSVLRTSRSELLRLLRVQGQPLLFIKRLLQRLSTVLPSADSIEVLFGDVKSHMKSKARAKLAQSGLGIVKLAAESFPGMFTGFAGTLCSLVASAPGPLRADALRAFADAGELDVSARDAKTTLPKIKALAETGTPDQAELAVRCIAKFPGSKKVLRTVAREAADALDSSAQAKGLATRLRALRQIAETEPDAFADGASDAASFVLSKLLAKTGRKMSAARAEGVALVANYPLYLEEPAVAKPDVERTLDVLFEAIGGDDAELRLAAAKGIVDLCTEKAFYALVRAAPERFVQLALVVEDPDLDVVEGFVEHLFVRLAGRKRKAPFELASALALCSANGRSDEPKREKAAAARATTLLGRLVQKRIRLVELMTQAEGKAPLSLFPEVISSHVVYLLSKHPMLEEDQPEYRHFTKILGNFFGCFVVQGGRSAQFSLLLNILSRIKLYNDAKDSENEEIYRIAELAHLTLKTKIKGKQWGEVSHPLQIGLPSWLYTRVKKPRNKIFLDKNFSAKSPSPSRKRNRGAQREAPDDENSISGQASSGSASKTRKSSPKQRSPRRAPLADKASPKRVDTSLSRSERAAARQAKKSQAQAKMDAEEDGANDSASEIEETARRSTRRTRRVK